jgi:hypothetical protein
MTAGAARKMRANPAEELPGSKAAFGVPGNLLCEEAWPPVLEHGVVGLRKDDAASKKPFSNPSRNGSSASKKVGLLVARNTNELTSACHHSDLGPRGITVNAVQPGPTETDMNSSVPISGYDPHELSLIIVGSMPAFGTKQACRACRSMSAPRG